MLSRKAGTGNLLCVSNFRANAGYAWDFIERLYAAIADDLAAEGVSTWVAYPTIEDPPAALSSSAAMPIEMGVDLRSPRSLWRLAREIRRRDIRTVYFSDRRPWHPSYVLLRAVGVRRIIVHDHASGRPPTPTGLRGIVKRLSRLYRPALADAVLAVSDFVGRRAVEVGLVPPARVHVVANSVGVPPAPDRAALRRRFGIPRDRPVIACACRAAEYKGVHFLLRAFALLDDALPERPTLVYLGDGPYMDELRTLRDALSCRDDVHFAGYVPDAEQLIAGADVCVVPSVWEEAFGLAALEPAAAGIPVVATAVGGIPEVVVDGETGILVPPGDPRALAAAIEKLLADETLRRSMGRRGRERAGSLFSHDSQVDRLRSVLRRLVGVGEASCRRATRQAS